MLVLVLALVGSITGEAVLNKQNNNKKREDASRKRTITQDAVEILKEQPYTIRCSEVYFKGANVEGDSSIKWATEKVMYVKGGETTNFKYVFRIPADTKLWQIKKGIVTKCREFKNLGPSTIIVLIADWNEWSTCDVMQCKQKRSRPCLECEKGTEVELQACNDTTICLKPCYTLQEPALTEDSDLVLSWVLGAQCVGEAGNVRISSAGRLVHLLPVAADVSTVQFPYNSQKNYNIGLELKGRYNGTPSDLLNSINVNETTFNFHCKKRTSEETYDLTCQYDALVKINITINDVLQGDYTGRGSIGLAETFCNENKTLQISAKSASGEEINISEYLEAKSDAECNEDTFMSPNEVSDESDDDDDVTDPASDVQDAENDVTDAEKDVTLPGIDLTDNSLIKAATEADIAVVEENEPATKFPSINSRYKTEKTPDVVTELKSDVTEDKNDVIKTEDMATKFPTIVDNDVIDDKPTKFPTIPPSEAAEEVVVEDEEVVVKTETEEKEVVIVKVKEKNSLGEEEEKDRYLNEKYGQDPSNEYERDEDKYKYDKYGEKIMEEEDEEAKEEAAKSEESSKSGTVAMEVLNTLMLVLIPFWVL